jgi:hypothetical protein
MASKHPKIRSRYSIGEWYGRPFEVLTPRERYNFARHQLGTKTLEGLHCPFQRDRVCKKKGGVCSLRKYEQVGDGQVMGTGPLITTCPNRFAQNGTVFQWIGKTILDTTEPLILGQVGFLHRLKRIEEEDDENDSRDFVGRIDNVLVHPTGEPMDWCAVELQAVYFSGKSMVQEFTMLAARGYDDLPFPAAHRRPDWRSSGPKRLLPQLQTKVPMIRTWGKKMAVVIDEAFFSSLVGLKRERHLSNAEIVWFVVKYELKVEQWILTPKEEVYTQLQPSVEALTGGIPLSKQEFENQLKERLSKLKG